MGQTMSRASRAASVGRTWPRLPPRRAGGGPQVRNAATPEGSHAGKKVEEKVLAIKGKPCVERATGSARPT
jgi:hypothetical protein